jgi:hypothetical protein
MNFKELKNRYAGAPIAWAVTDLLEEYLEKRGESDPITLTEIRQKVMECEFEPGMPELHRILAEREPEFVRYLFELAKGELESAGFMFTQVDSSAWTLRRPRSG